ncbi:MgtC/SapB family protein [Rubrivivax sp. RP6-9]|uniref:MgtC/SapB family protein n=1 Tax=Rubrivivax sp. RP6-9 TaxID=3415750 RepID=UPI003CC617B4
MTQAVPALWGLAAALGSGLLIGLERERRKGRGRDREAAGIRSFTLAALAGGLAQTLQQPLLVALGGLAVLVLVGVAYARSQFVARQRDPGLTTELALVVTYLVGVLCAQAPAAGAAAAVVVAVLLAARERLHRFATRALSEGELHDALLLAALLLVALPLLPAAPVAWLGGLQPRMLGLLVLLILALQAAGHVALRLFGARAGLALSGLFSGFVSSTATVASMGARARAEPARQAACEAGAMLSTAATWVQALLMLTAVSPPLARHIAPAAVAALLVAAGSGVWRARGAAAAATLQLRGGGPLRVREALLVAALLSVVTLAVGAAQRHFGVQGVFASVALSALADAHASVTALGGLHAAGQVALDDAGLAVLLAVSTNALTRSVVAFTAGGGGFGTRVALSLAASTACGWAVLLLAA